MTSGGSDVINKAKACLYIKGVTIIRKRRLNFQTLSHHSIGDVEETNKKGNYASVIEVQDDLHHNCVQWSHLTWGRRDGEG